MTALTPDQKRDRAGLVAKMRLKNPGFDFAAAVREATRIVTSPPAAKVPKPKGKAARITAAVTEALTAAQVPVPPPAAAQPARRPAARPALMAKAPHEMSPDEWAVYSGAMLDTYGEALGMKSPIWRGIDG